MSIRVKNIAICPECGAEVRFRKSPYLHQSKLCVECGVELEVVNKNPLEVDVIYEDDDDEFELDNYDDDLY
jgi:lysine biosynthesis protein LysW